MNLADVLQGIENTTHNIGNFFGGNKVIPNIESALGNKLNQVQQFGQQHILSPVVQSTSNFEHGNTGWQQAVQGYLNQHVGAPLQQFGSSAGRALVSTVLNPGVAGTGDERFDQPPPSYVDKEGNKISTRQYNQSAIQNFNTNGSNTAASNFGNFVGSAGAYFIPGAQGMVVGNQVGQQLGNLSSNQGLANAKGEAAKDVALGLVNTLPGLPTSKLTAGLSPLLRYGANAGVAGTENVLRGQASNIIETGRPDTDLKSNLEQFAVGAGLHTVLHPSESLAAGKQVVQKGSEIHQNVKDLPGLTRAAQTYKAPLPETETSVVNGVQVNRPADLVHIAVPEEQAHQILRSSGAVDPQLIDHTIPGAKVHITLDSNRHVISWEPENHQFAIDVAKNLQQGQNFATNQPGYFKMAPDNPPPKESDFNSKGYEVNVSKRMSDNMRKAQNKYGDSAMDLIGKDPDKLPPEQQPNVQAYEDKRVDKSKDGVDVVGEVIGSRGGKHNVVMYTIDDPSSHTPDNRNPNIVDTLKTAQENGAKTIGDKYSVSKPLAEPTIQEPTTLSARDQARSAISEKLAAEDKIRYSAQIAARSAKEAGLVEKDAALFRDTMEHPEDLQKNLAQVKNKDGFQTALERYRNFTNDVYKVATESGRDYPFRKNYYNHEFDRSLLPPEAQAEFQDFSQARLNRNAGSKSEAPRVFDDLRQAEKYGAYLQQKYGLEKNPFVQKNTSVEQDISDLANRSRKAAGASAFVKELKRVAPGQVAVGSKEGIPEGFFQLHVPGLKDTFVSPELYQHLKVLEPSAFADNPVIRAIDKANRILKGVILQGPFHAFKETINFAGDQLGQLKLPNFVQSTHLAVSPHAFAEYMNESRSSGFLDTAANLNLKIGGTDFEDLSKSNLSMHSITFDRLIPYYKLESLKTALGNAEIDLSTPEGVAQGKKIAEQVNNFYGGLQNDLNGRNKTVQQVLRFGFLAPDFNEGKLRTGVNAIMSWDGTSGNLARSQLIGSLAITALVVEMGRRFATGKWDDLKDGLKNTVLDPNIPLPSQFNKPGSDVQQTVHIPGSVGSDLYKLAADPQQALQSRGSALISFADKVISGKDYYGNPLVNPYENPNPTLWDNAKASWKAELPIPLQNAESAREGKISPGAAIINSLGGRVGNDPNDAKQIATTDYFNKLDTFKKTLNPNEMNIFNALSPTKKDQNGNVVYTKNVLSTPSQYELLLANPAFMQKYMDYQRQNSDDPLWHLSGKQIKNYLTAEVISKNDPGGDSKTTGALFNTLPPDFFKNRSNYFNSLVSQGVIQPSATSQSPQMSPELQSYQNMISQAKAQGQSTGAYYKTPTGQALLNFYTQSEAYTNTKRVAQGLPAISRTDNYTGVTTTPGITGISPTGTINNSSGGSSSSNKKSSFNRKKSFRVRKVSTKVAYKKPHLRVKKQRIRIKAKRV